MRRFGVRLRSCPKARKGAASRLPWLEVGMGTLVFLEGGCAYVCVCLLRLCFSLVFFIFNSGRYMHSFHKFVLVYVCVCV